jgi:hypothetical protein
MRRTHGFAAAAVIAAFRVLSGSNADAQERPAVTEGPGPSGAPAPARSTVVQITGDARASILARFDYLGSGPKGGYYSVTRVCGAPCGVGVPDDGSTYRVLGPGLTPSAAFTLPSGAPRVDVDVRRGSWGRHAAGLVLTVIGGAYTSTGAGFVIARDAGAPAPLMPIGTVFLAVGATALAVGLPLWLTGRTHIDVRPGGKSESAWSQVTLAPNGLFF